MKKNILLTFDYELYLGDKSGTVDNCLIIPTGKLIELLRKHNAKAIFFVDTTYLKRLTEVSGSSILAKNDLDNITKQLIEIADQGHYLFHHIHPHWIDAVYLPDENQWSLQNISKYTLNLISDTEREQLFFYSYKILSEIIRKSNNNNEPEGFRAGGAYIEPFGVFKDYFKKYKIKYEFSAVPYLKKQDGIFFYDFSSCPSEPFYNFEDEASIKDISGSFTEFTITQFELKGVTKILNGIYYRAFKNKNKNYGDGLSVSSFLRNSEKDKSFKRFFISQNDLSIELMNPVITSHYKKLVKRNNYLHFISHPKLISKQNLDLFDNFLKFLSKVPNVEFDFKKFHL